MTRLFILLLAVALSATYASAQDTNAHINTHAASAGTEQGLGTAMHDSLGTTDVRTATTISPALYSPTPTNFVPYMYAYPAYSLGFAGWNSWRLHEGLNASISASAMVGLGKHSVSGFGSQAVFMYAMQLTPRLSVAAGMYANTFHLGGYTTREAGLSAVAAYRFTPRLTGYVYFTKALVKPDYSPYLPLYTGGDRLGVALDWRANKTLSFQVNFETISLPGGAWAYPGMTMPGYGSPLW